MADETLEAGEQIREEDRFTYVREEVTDEKAMERAKEAAMGIAEAGCKQRPRTADLILWRPLSMGCHKDVCGQGDFQRCICKSRTRMLSRLL